MIFYVMSSEKNLESQNCQGNLPAMELTDIINRLRAQLRLREQL